MDTVMQWINEPGPIRFVVDIVVLPVIAGLLIYGLRSLYLRVALRESQSDAARQVRRQASRALAFLLTLGSVSVIWRARMHSLAGRADVTLEEREALVNWLGGVVNAIIATALLIFLIVILGRIFRWGVRRLDTWQEIQRGLQVQGKTLITRSRFRQFAVLGMRIARFVIVLGLFYLYVPLVFSFVPATQPLAGRVMPVVVGPARDLGLAVIRYLPRLASLIIIVMVMRFVIRFVDFLVAAVGHEEISVPGFDPEWAEPTGRLLRIVLILGTIMLIYPFLPGAGSEVFRGFSLFVGAVFTFGASSSVSNLISGIILTFTGTFRIGDRIQLGKSTGDVVTRGLFVTRLRTVCNEIVTVPNNVALSDRVVNYSARAASDGLALSVTAGIGYDVDWRKVHELMKAAARSTERLLETPEPMVLQTELTDFAVAYELRAWTNDANRMRETQSTLRRNVLDAFNEAGVEIMTPSVNALRNSADPAIPEDYLGGVTPPGLRFLGPQGSPA